MKRELESALESRCVAKVEALGGQALKLVLLGLMGFPDRTLLLPGGRVLFVEFKRAVVGRASRQQNYWRDILVRLGFVVEFVDSDAEFDRILERV